VTQIPSTLTDAIQELREAVVNLDSRLDLLIIQRRRQRVGTVLVVLGVIVSLLLGLSSWALFKQTSDLRDRVLCPLYNTFLAFEDRSVNAPDLSASEVQQIRDGYKTIHDGYQVLSCR
jgi:hypothetical protein